MDIQYKIAYFSFVTIGLIWISWPSLRNFQSFGFFRFFAWEAIVGLILIQFDYWFHDPLGLRQVISWILLLISVVLVISGAVALKRSGKPDKSRGAPHLRGIEKTTRLVTGGIYRYIRHPLYSSMLIGGVGVFLKRPAIDGVILIILLSIFVLITAKKEEGENLRYFGPEYQNYMNGTKRFIPFLF
jgi:protein-S-isoprenylcysteine O-methyltransferase Ste14